MAKRRRAPSKHLVICPKCKAKLHILRDAARIRDKRYERGDCINCCKKNDNWPEKRTCSKCLKKHKERFSIWYKKNGSKPRSTRTIENPNEIGVM